MLHAWLHARSCFSNNLSIVCPVTYVHSYIQCVYMYTYAYIYICVCVTCVIYIYMYVYVKCECLCMHNVYICV